MNLQQKTETLLAVCKECFERHAQMRELNREPDFFIEVKPYADQYHTLVDEWTEEVSDIHQDSQAEICSSNSNRNTD